MRTWIEKILCRLRWHKWDYSYITDKNDPLKHLGHLHIISGNRKCQRINCNVKQRMAKEIFGYNKIRWEKL